MNRVLISKEDNPYINIAMEKLLFEHAQEDLVLFLWQNSPSVILGRNQNMYAECDLDYLKENNIFPVRRFSGGGAVYHDKGNVNFTFVTKESLADEAKLLSVVKTAMQALGIDAEFSGRNDVLCDGRKFSGHAWLVDDGNYMYHGTIMINVDLHMLEKAITPSKLKLQSKGISSVRSRIINLAEKSPEITVQAVMLAMENAFCKVFGECEKQQLLSADDEALALAKKLSSDEWLVGECPQFSMTLEKMLLGKNVSVSAEVENGIIKKAKVSTDSLEMHDIEKCEQGLVGLPFCEKNVFFYLEKFFKTI
ncbi:lipoate--protein ligase [Oscillospiraceae bacterium PP1C4]